jgi:hypothetical protein
MKDNDTNEKDKTFEYKVFMFGCIGFVGVILWLWLTSKS